MGGGACRREEERQRGRGKDRRNRRVQMFVLVHACVPPTSEALTRPSWKEQLEGSWVHKLRYLHQWQRKALFTHDRHLHGSTHTQTEGESGKSQGEAAILPNWGKRHGGNEFRSRVGTCCSCALVVGTGPDRCWAKFSLHIFTIAMCLYSMSRVSGGLRGSPRDQNQMERGRGREGEWRNVE